MILYLDTSALVKKYFQEKNSSEVISAWKESFYDEKLKHAAQAEGVDTLPE